MRRLLALSVMALATSVGCHMCASPYDYCGPVVESGCMEPNGRGGCYGGHGSCGCGCGSGETAGMPTEGAPINGQPMDGQPMDGQEIESAPEMVTPQAMPSGAPQGMPSPPPNMPNPPQGMPSAPPSMPTPANPGGYNPAAWRQSNQTMQYR